MDLQNQPDQLNPQYEECLRLAKCWGWFLTFGIILVVLGILAIGAAFITTFTSVLVFGVLLLSGGVVQIVNAFLARKWQAFLLHLLIGLLHLIVGGLMIKHPLRAAEGLTLMLAVAFLVAGAVRVISALIQHFAGWGWVLVNGFITFLLGIMIWRQWPESSLWVIGLFIGIDLVFNGWSWVMLGLMLKVSTSGSGRIEAQAPGSVQSGTP